MTSVMYPIDPDPRLFVLLLVLAMIFLVLGMVMPDRRSRWKCALMSAGGFCGLAAVYSVAF